MCGQLREGSGNSAFSGTKWQYRSSSIPRTMQKRMLSCRRAKDILIETFLNFAQSSTQALPTFTTIQRERYSSFNRGWHWSILACVGGRRFWSSKPGQIKAQIRSVVNSTHTGCGPGSSTTTLCLPPFGWCAFRQDSSLRPSDTFTSKRLRGPLNLWRPDQFPDPRKVLSSGHAGLVLAEAGAGEPPGFRF